ncbi:MAG TPA: hypothetical protein PKC79_11745 [Solidesulfovibrio magneticus]|nr:hypothetical protein [Solidesulfovibrio magneticus]
MTISFDHGTEVMLGNYYNSPGSCFVNQDISSLGHSIAEYFNKKKETICDKIIEALKSEQFEEILEVKIDDCTRQCFIKESDVEFNKTYKYIKFPYFNIPALDGFQIGIDINPCIGSQDSRTKIYGIFRYYDTPCTIDFIKKFSKKSMVLCNSIVRIIAKQYFEYINTNFVNTNITLDNYYSIYSIGIGSTDTVVQKYIDLSNDNEKFEALYTSNRDAQTISTTLLDLCELASNNSRAMYWWTKNTFIYDESDDDLQTEEYAKSTRKTTAFIGRYGEETKAFFIALVNNKPKFALRPLNIGLINKH